MTTNEILCNAVLSSDIEKGLDDAVRNFSIKKNLANRPMQDYLAALQRHCVRVCSERALIRFLHNHGVSHNFALASEARKRIYEKICLIGETRVRLITYQLPDTFSKAHHALEAMALVANAKRANLWHDREQFDRYVFVFFAGNLRISLRQTLSDLLRPSGTIARESVIAESNQCVTYVTAAPTVQQCEKLFQPVAAGSKCVQFPEGAPLEFAGCAVRQLTAFRRVVSWGGV